MLGLIVWIDEMGHVTGSPHSPGALPLPTPPGSEYRWPRGFMLIRAPAGYEWVSPDGGLTIRNGTQLADLGVCVGGTPRIKDPGRIVSP